MKGLFIVLSSLENILDGKIEINKLKEAIINKSIHTEKVELHTCWFL
jgi:hypothetical protein